MRSSEWKLERRLVLLVVVATLAIVVGVATWSITKIVALLVAWLALSVINLLWPFNIMLLECIMAWVLVANRNLSQLRRKILLAAIIAGLVIIIGYFAYSAIQHRRTVVAVSIARSKVDTAAEQRLVKMRQALQASGLVAEPMASSKVDVCYITDSESGWFANGWYQRCYLRYVAGYYTNSSRGDVIAKATTLSNEFGEVQTARSLELFPCEIFEASYHETLRYRPAHVRVSDGYQCDQPGLAEDDLGGYDERSAHKIKTYAGFDPAKIDASKNQIWIILQTDDYYNEDLGCRVLLVCQNPRSVPIQAE